jgi:hypothetical protein
MNQSGLTTLIDRIAADLSRLYRGSTLSPGWQEIVSRCSHELEQAGELSTANVDRVARKIQEADEARPYALGLAPDPGMKGWFIVRRWHVDSDKPPSDEEAGDNLNEAIDDARAYARNTWCIRAMVIDKRLMLWADFHALWMERQMEEQR